MRRHRALPALLALTLLGQAPPSRALDDSDATVVEQRRDDGRTQAALRYGLRLAPYAEVSRSDGTYRRMFVEQATLAGLQPGAALPDGATIVMESYGRDGTITSVFRKTKQDGRWLYGSFQPDRPNDRLSPRPSCRSCHLAATEDGTFTLPLLHAFAGDRSLRRIACERSGRSPCGPATYTVD